MDSPESQHTIAERAPADRSFPQPLETARMDPAKFEPTGSPDPSIVPQDGRLNLGEAGITASPSEVASANEPVAEKVSEEAAASRKNSFTSGKDKLSLLAGAQARRGGPRGRNRQNNSESAGTLLKQVGRWRILQDSTVNTDDSAGDDRLNNFNPFNPPVVKNEETGAVGIATGQFIVYYREKSAPDAIASTHRLRLVSVNETNRQAFMRATVGQDLVSTLNALVADADVESATMDIIYDRQPGK